MTLDDGSLNLPAFAITCDRPCEIEDGAVEMVMSTPGPIFHISPTKPGMVFLAPRPVAAGQHPFLFVKSNDSLPVTILKVVTLSKSELPPGVE
jgi:hypothetical protein